MLIQFEIRKLKLARPVLSAPVLDRRHFPGRGVLYSVLLHEIIFFGLLFLQLFMAAENPPRLEVLGTINLHNPADVLYFPVMPRVAAEPVEQVESARPTPNRKSVTYPGPQEIVSNFHDPTNFIQTVLQPALQNPSILKPPLLLPNILQMPNAAPLPTITAPVAAAKPVIPAPPDPAVKPPQPILPVKAESAAVEAPKFAIPETKVSSALPKPMQPLLALTPMPASPVQPPTVPAGEARGNFTISPEANLGTPNAASDKDVGSSKSGKEPGAASTAGVKPVTAASNETGNSSSNRPSPPATNPFEGITILGGSTSVSTTANASPPSIVSIGSSRSVESSYGGITVISTASSGGGLSHSEVFSNETIYTVYLDLKRTANDGAPSWIFEFGVQPRNDRNKTTAQTEQGIILPFPISKEQPAFPSELVRKYLRQRIIVYAIVHTDGKMQQMTVKETPDPGLNEAVLTALSKWTFRPAQLDGESVPTKVLIGIPVYP